MKNIIIKCDRCGKDISPDKLMYGRKSHIELELEYCHYGSMGGSEDIDEFDFDLCDNCARELSYNIKKFLRNE